MQFPITKSLVAVVLAAVTAGHATPVADAEVRAVPAPAAFPLGRVCVDVGLTGGCQTITGDRLPTGCTNFGSGFTDSISSIMVGTGFSCTFFIHANCQGGSITVSNGNTAKDLTGTDFNDSISSFSCVAA